MFFGNGWVGLPVCLMQDEDIHPPLKAPNLWMDGEFVVVNHRKDGIQMHKGVTLGDLKRNHRVKIRLGKELRRHQLNRLWRGALTNTDGHRVVIKHQLITALN